jgi:DNA-binding transcriptional LysR family regulator
VYQRFAGFVMDVQMARCFVIYFENKLWAVVAKQLGLTEGAISKKIKKLEIELGQSLFYRSGNRDFTPAGLIVYQYALKTLHNHQAMHEELALLDHAASSLNLMMNNIIARTDFMEIFGQLSINHPDLRLIRSEGSTKDIIEGVKSGIINAGVTIEKRIAQGLVFTPYKKGRFCIVTPINHRLAPKQSVRLADALKHPMIMPASKQIQDYIKHVAKQRNVDIIISAITHSFEEQLALASQTEYGIAVVAEHIARKYQETHQNIVIVDLENEFDMAEYCIVTKENPTPATQIFLNLVKEHFKL